MTLVQNTCPDRVKLLQRRKIDILDSNIQKEVEVLESLEAGVDEVGGSDGVDVIHVSSEGVEYLGSKFGRKWGDLQSISGDFENILIVLQREERESKNPSATSFPE